jgi:spore germination protein GerM
VKYRVAGCVVAMILLLGACGGSRPQGSPEKLDKDAVPFGLLEEPTSTVPPTTVPQREYPFVVYFMGNEGPVLALRTASSKPDAQTVGKALLEGPTRDEVQVGLRTSIPKRAIGRIGNVAEHTVTIDLNAPFTEVSGQAQTRALAQMVLTMTSLHGVTRVRFLLDGEPVSVPRADGTVTRAPVRRADYLPRRTP